MKTEKLSYNDIFDFSQGVYTIDNLKELSESLEQSDRPKSELEY